MVFSYEKGGMIRKMKTNITNLMSIVGEEEKKFNENISNLATLAITSSIQELDGRVNVTEDTKEDFEETFNECTKSQSKLTKIKSIIYAKNNEFKLSDGRTIQEAIVDNTNLRKMKEVYKSLITLRNSKERVTEVHNSYFNCKTINFNMKDLKKEYEELENRIQKTDFEISKLNSIEFEIEL